MTSCTTPIGKSPLNRTKMGGVKSLHVSPLPSSIICPRSGANLAPLLGQIIMVATSVKTLECTDNYGN